MKILFFGLKRNLFTAVLAASLGLFAGTAFADDHHESSNAAVSNACVSFNEAKAYEEEAKKHEDELKDEEEAKSHEDELKDEDEAKKHEDEAKKHEDEAKNFENHKVPEGATSCTTSSGLPGFLPASATSSTGAKVYREIRGQ